MIRRLPLLPTLIVGAAVALMIGLGFWQVDRLHWKQQLLAEYAAAAGQPAIAWPAFPDKDHPPLFRKSSFNCLRVVEWRSASGRSAADQPGWIHIASCSSGGIEGPGAQLVMGWSTRPDNPQWTGGRVRGTIAPDTRHVIRLIADTPAPGLLPAQVPSVESIPNNHLAYAVQWFLFAGIAIAIYGLALRQRWISHRRAEG